MNKDFDFLVIGAGSAGVRAARIAAGHGARVAVVEDRALGGTCVNLGCVPKKFLVQAARYNQEMRDAAGYGWQVQAGKFDWTHLIRQKDQEIHRLNGIYGGLLEGSGVTILNGRGTFLDPHTVDIPGIGRVSAEKILIATGGVPVRPDIPGIEHAITSDEAFHLTELPEKIIIVGAGYIAVEFAGIFHGLGVEVVLLHRGDALLRGFDDDIRQHLGRAMIRQGIDLRLSSTITSINRNGDQVQALLDNGQMLLADQIMFATGRRPGINGLGLFAAGVQHDDQGRIAVNDDYQTSQLHIYAVGDVIDRVALTPVAIREGHFVADQLFGPKPGRRIDYHLIATAVFSTPEIGTIGVTEAAALAEPSREYQVFRTEFRPMLYALAGRDERALMKIVVEKETRRVVGLHMIGKDAGEIVQGFAVAITMGATKDDFDRTMAIHPTIAEEFVTLKG